MGGNIQPTLREFYQQAETAAKAKLARIILQDVLDTITVRQARKMAGIHHQPPRLINSPPRQ